MLHINPYGIKHGVYACGNVMVVPMEIVTHRFVNGIMEELEHPMVVYRDLYFKMTEHIVYEMDLEIFKQKFNPL